MIGNRTYYIDQINSSKANKMTAYYHYSGVGFKKAVLNLGIYRRSDDLLVGVLQWGCSFQEKIRLDRYVKEPISKSEYLELNRFSMADSEPKNAESQAISLGIKWIKKYKPEIKLLVSYAGRKEGNYGYIYQATNWEYLGYFISPGFWFLDGHEKHLMTLWCQYDKSPEKENMGFTEFLCYKYKDVRQTWTKQFIYIQRLDNCLTPANTPLEYPKPSTDAPIKTRERIIQEDDEIFNNPVFEEREKVEYYYEKEKYLFSRATLLRRGVLKKDNRKILMYDEHGNFEREIENTEDAKSIGYNLTRIRKAIEEKKFYKDKFFIYINDYEETPQEIEVPYICIIDEISFASYTNAAKYLGVSKQAVQQSKTRLGKKIAGKEVIWNPEFEK